MHHNATPPCRDCTSFSKCYVHRVIDFIAAAAQLDAYFDQYVVDATERIAGAPLIGSSSRERVTPEQVTTAHVDNDMGARASQEDAARRDKAEARHRRRAKGRR